MAASSEWSKAAFLACIRQLSIEGPTHAHLVKIVDAWTGPGDSLSFVYYPPWDTEVFGLKRTRGTYESWGYLESDGETEISAEGFGRGVAVSDLGEPLRGDPETLWRDSAGVRWWGDSI
jgi:hypothetical protein